MGAAADLTAEEKKGGVPAPIEEPEHKLDAPAELTVRSANLAAREVRLADILTLDEVKLTGEDIRIRTGRNGTFSISGLTATLTITESALNKFLSGRVEDQLNSLQVRMLNGKVRIEGKYRMFPFTFTAVPEIEGGARLRLDPRQMSLIGLPIPGVGAQVIGEKINTRLSRAFDITRLPLPLRLTSLIIETGRLLLSAAGDVELTSNRNPL
jgi:hypothetical protein